MPPCRPERTRPRAQQRGEANGLGSIKRLELLAIAAPGDGRAPPV